MPELTNTLSRAPAPGVITQSRLWDMYNRMVTFQTKLGRAGSFQDKVIFSHPTARTWLPNAFGLDAVPWLNSLGFSFCRPQEEDAAAGPGGGVAVGLPGQPIQ